MAVLHVLGELLLVLVGLVVGNRVGRGAHVGLVDHFAELQVVVCGRASATEGCADYDGNVEVLVGLEKTCCQGKSGVCWNMGPRQRPWHLRYPQRPMGVVLPGALAPRYMADISAATSSGTPTGGTSLPVMYALDIWSARTVPRN